MHTGVSPSFLVRHQATYWYLNLNQDQPLFKNNPKLSQAVNYAIDRPQMVRQHGALGGVRTDQILPIGFPGYKDANIYPLQGLELHQGRRAGEGQPPRRQV